MRTSHLVLVLFALAATASAQANKKPGIDVGLALVEKLQAMKHAGTYPDGVSAFAMTTTCCNHGTETVPWKTTEEGTPMQSNHPYIAFLVARESGGRLEQISGYSAVKHGFSALAESYCDTCQPVPVIQFGKLLGIGCADTYSVFNNADDYWLAPAEEIDPWLGTWSPWGSYFDRGDPDVGAPANQDGLRSLDFAQVAAFGPIGNRIRIEDADLAVEGANFFYQGYYVIRREPEEVRGNNFRTRRFQPTWNGSKWNTDDLGQGVEGSILESWSGASVSSAGNGEDDGRAYVGVVVTGPTDGLYHYEYAVHNRDAHRKVGALRIPFCPGATITGAGFRDIDDDAANDWSFAVEEGELVWRTEDAPLRWNSFYNFWFDSDAAPEDASVVYEPFDEGAGLDEIVVDASRAPLGLYNVNLGAGCSFTEPPTLFADGDPAQASLGNASFGLVSRGHDPGAAVLWLGARQTGSATLDGGCTFYLGGVPGGSLLVLGIESASGAGDSRLATPVPAAPNLEGLTLGVQVLSARAAGGPFAGRFDLSNGLEVRIGSDLAACPE